MPSDFMDGTASRLAVAAFLLVAVVAAWCQLKVRLGPGRTIVGAA